MVMMRCAIWAAVSSKSQAADDKISIPNQLARGNEIATANNWQVTIQLVVDGYSRSITRVDRAIDNVGGYQIVNGVQSPCKPYGVLCDLIENKSIDILIFFDMDRLGRSSVLAQTILQLARDFGIKYFDVSNPTPFDTQDTEGAMYTGAFAGIRSAMYIKQLQIKHRDGMIARTLAGRWPGEIPWGWIGHWVDGVNGKRALQSVELDPLAAAHIRTILIDWYLNSGWGYAQIAENLNSLSILTPKGLQWETSNVQSILRKVWRYAGYAEINKRSSRPYTKAKGDWIIIITEAEAEMIVAERERRRYARRSVSNTYLLSGVVYCARCKRPMIMAVNRRNRPSARIQQSLRCPIGNTGYHLDGAPKKAFISVNKVLVALHEEFLDLQNETTRADIVALSGAVQIDQGQLDALDARQKRLEASQSRVDRDYYLDERIDIARHRALSDDIARQLVDVGRQRDQLQRLVREQQSRVLLAESLADTAVTGPAILTDSDVKKSNAWLRQRLRIYVMDRQVIRIDYLSFGMSTE